MAKLNIQDRIVKLVKIKASELVPNSWNFREHPEKQREVFRDVLSEIGFAGAVLVRELENGKYGLIDGHLRREELGDQKIPVLVTDLTEEEAKKLLACYDPISALAETDRDALASLVKDMSIKGKALASLFSELTSGSKVLKPADLELDIEDDDSSDNNVDGGLEKALLQTSHVRMLQLYLNGNNVVEFQDLEVKAAEKFGTETLTDTVFECLRFIANQKVTSKKKKELVEN